MQFQLTVNCGKVSFENDDSIRKKEAEAPFEDRKTSAILIK